MKQTADTFTGDMFGAATGSKNNHRFYITTAEGETTEWTGLTKKQARDMYAYTTAHQPHNVVSTGWEELT